MESEDTDKFIRESNLDIINEYVHNNVDDPDEIQDSTIENKCSDITGLGASLSLSPLPIPRTHFCLKLNYALFRQKHRFANS